MNYISVERNKFNPLYSTWFPFVILSILGVILFHIKGVSPSPDSSWYLNNALKIYNDFSFDNLMIRRPLFPLLMALSFKIFGLSVESGFYIVRFFFVLMIPFSYMIGLKIFNKVTGVAFSLLVLTSFVINRWSSFILVDAIIPFFILLFIFLVFLSFENNNKFYAALAGIVLGLAFLTKGVFAAFYLLFPVAVVLLIKKYRIMANFENLIIIFISTIILLAPWLYYCYRENDFIILVGHLFNTDKIQGKGFVPSLSDSVAISSGLLILIKTQIHDFIQFVNIYINRIFVLSYLFIVSFLYFTYQAVIKRKNSYIIVILAIILFSPFIYIGMRTGGVSFRNGQFLILYLLLYLMSAALIVDLSKSFSKMQMGKIVSEKIFYISFISILTACLVCQIFIGARGERNFYSLLKGEKVSNASGFSYWQGDFETRGWAKKTVQQAGKWIKENIPQGTPLLCQWHYLRFLDFFTEHYYQFHELKYSTYNDKNVGVALFVWPEYDYQRLRGNKLVVLYEENVLSPVNNKNIQYVIVTYRRNFLSLYLDKHPDFDMVKSFANGEIKIYRVNKDPVEKIIKFDVKFHKDIYQMFSFAYGKDKTKFNQYVKELKTITNWSDKKISEFIKFVQNKDLKQFWKRYDQIKSRTVY